MAPLPLPPPPMATMANLPHLLGELKARFESWEQATPSSEEELHLTKELAASCENFETLLDSVEKAMAADICSQLKRMDSAYNQVCTVKSAVERHLHGTDHYSSQHNSDYNESETDRMHDDEFGANAFGGTTISAGLLHAICELKAMFGQWKQAPSNTGTKELLTTCGNIDRLLDDLEEQISSEMSRQQKWCVSTRDQVGVIWRAVARRHVLTTPEELSAQDPWVPLNKKESIKVMKVVSVAVLTMIAALSTHAANAFAPEVHRRLLQEMLLMSPNVCIGAALIGVGFSYCASEGNGLAEYAAIAIILVCVFGICLGASAIVIVLHASTVPTVPRVTGIWIHHLIVALLVGWGWLFSYPTGLKVLLRLVYWAWFDRRRITYPLRELYANPRSAHQTDEKGFGIIVSTCQRAFKSLDEAETITIMNTFAPYVLTPISTLSLWAANTVAPRASMFPTMQWCLYTLPYVYLPIGVIGIALSAATTSSNRLANCASSLGVFLCACGVLLGASCTIVVLHTGLLGTMLVACAACALILALVILWGWIFAYPKMLRYAVRLNFCSRICMPLRVFGGNMVRFASRPFDLCPRTARGWWRPVRSPSAGAAGLELPQRALS